MAHTLIGFLGRGALDAKTGYRKTKYRFPDGIIRETPFFSMALLQYLKADIENPPDGMVLLGTEGSMWGVLAESLAKTGENEEARLQLYEAETRGRVTEEILASIQPIADRAFGCPVRMRLIPYCRDETEQIAILKTIADVTPKGRVSFDLTHGFRHLGMVGFMAAFMLERISDATTVAGLWYGALDMIRDGVAPVIRLDGLMRVHRWIAALDRYDARGDYGVFADLLQEDGLDAKKTTELSMAAFHEGNSNILDASKHLKPVIESLAQPLEGPSGLFQKRLQKRLSWVNQKDRAVQQLALAHVAFKRNDYLRCAILAIESIVTRRCLDSKLDPWKTEHREQVKTQLNRMANRSPSPAAAAYFTLNNLRNALAHSAPPKDETAKQLLQNPKRMKAELQAILKEVTFLVKDG
ncbi:TIGR02221 family CRISPR-associated protein [Desulfatirhabdium butyrativorans]|uniref:TIGR02221 family CRISPR-associated protein n=1 Tax=Desulfatirhabdium butyrativorans TaxID=340467 RepID=UPI000419E5A1|nr:TIGR02221 family CRISPR-associated protein [Desulfatirhabdium butyrativorans]